MRFAEIINTWAEDQLNVISGVSNIGLARSILALSSLLTLSFNDTNWLFVNQSGSQISINKNSISLFYLFGAQHIEYARIACILILLIVIVGLWPRYTAILHWWVCYSFFSSAQLLDGGDQITTVLTLLLIPILFFTKNRTHWNIEFKGNFDQKIIIFFFLALARFQMCALYFEAATSKFAVAEWKDGTAVYYFLNNKAFGSTENITNFFLQLTSRPAFVVAITWGTIIIELLLCVAFFMNKKYWIILFWIGVIFHTTIYLTLGLSSFSLAMIAGLIIYLKPTKTSKPEIILIHG